MDIIQLYDDFSVDYRTEGHKHTRPGWVNTECPWCEGNIGYHLGYHLDDNYYVCWRCGYHPVVATVAKLIDLPERETYLLIKKYGSNIPRLPTKSIVAPVKEHRLPTNTGPLLEHHKRYLEKRNFDPDYLEREWNLLSTGPISKLDEYDYKNRILIPFIWDGQEVSFDTRIPQDKASHEERYKACPKNRELISHKDILYGRQDKWRKSGVLVEGPTDVWRFGVYSFAVSGIKYTPRQVRVISQRFKRVAVCFDDDPQAFIQATRIVAELKFRGVDAFRVDIEGDPGSMKQSEADYLVKQLIK
jgi:hypothetical protein